MIRKAAAAIFIAAAAYALFVWSKHREPFSVQGIHPMVTGESIAPERLEILHQILQSHNDNDPRLDSAFQGLTEKEKKDFRDEYKSLPPEKRNERGTIVYLLGKNIDGAADWEFFRLVAAEPACLSLADCGKAGGEKGPGDDVTLAYPSLVALKQAQNVLESGRDSEGARRVIAAGKASKMPAVVRLAEKLDRRFPKP
jgi:hypothetical protein